MRRRRGYHDWEMKVVAHRPRRRLLSALGLGGALLAAGVAGYFSARPDSRGSVARAPARVGVPQQRPGQMRAELEAILTGCGGDASPIGRAIALGAEQRLRTVVAKQRARIRDLEAENRLYGELMLGEEAPSGVRLARLDLLPRLDSPRIRYRLLLVHAAEQEALVEGQVRVRIVGEQDGEQVSLPLEALASVAAYPIPVSFRHFQKIAGELELPDGFRPRSVEVLASAETPSGWRRERTFPWHVQES